VDAQVGIVTAEDKDGPKHNVVGYSFVPGNTAADSFDLDQVNGVITAKTTLDRETQSVYYVIVRAYDKLAPAFSSTVTATIQVSCLISLILCE
jgi:Cadherin domain